MAGHRHRVVPGAEFAPESELELHSGARIQRPQRLLLPVACWCRRLQSPTRVRIMMPTTGASTRSRNRSDTRMAAASPLRRTALAAPGEIARLEIHHLLPGRRRAASTHPLAVFERIVRLRSIASPQSPGSAPAPAADRRDRPGGRRSSTTPRPPAGPAGASSCVERKIVAPPRRARSTISAHFDFAPARPRCRAHRQSPTTERLRETATGRRRR